MTDKPKPANKELEGIDGLTEDGYLPMPLILCKTSSRDSAIAARSLFSVCAVLAIIKNWIQVAR